MSYFEQDDNLEVTQEMLDNFASDYSSDYYNTAENDKTLEQIREERIARQEEKKLLKKQERHSKFINSFMPFMAFVLLVSTVAYMNSLQFGLEISYNDKPIGIVENADVINEATGIIDSRIINKSLDTLEDEPQYKVAIVTNTSDFQNSTELSRSIIANDNVLADEICGVFVDDTFVGAVENIEDAEEVLQSLKDAERKRQADLGDIESVDFNTNVSLETGLYAKSSIVDKSVLKERLENNVEITYRVTILEEQNVKIRYKTEYVVDSTKPEGFEKVTTQGQIGEGIATNRVEYIDGIKISAEHIKVVATKKPINEVITVSADSEHAAEAKMPDSDTNKNIDKTTEKTTDKNTDKDTDSTDTDSQEKSSGTENVKADTDKSNDNVSDTDTDTYAGTDTDTQQTSETEQKQASQFVWPAPTCGSITNDFGYQGEKLHKGIDISGYAAEGQPVVAAASGYVTAAVIDHGSENYGCYLVIDHGNGYQTLYGQCSDIYVSAGTYVEQGQSIAAIGSTGDATGPNLHFEVIENGQYVNPINYLY